MPARLGLDLRAATLDNAAMVADLEATRDPKDPRDPQMLRFWWSMASPDEGTLRLVARRGGSAVAFAGAGPNRWDPTGQPFGPRPPTRVSDTRAQAPSPHPGLIGGAWPPPK